MNYEKGGLLFVLVVSVFLGNNWSKRLISILYHISDTIFMWFMFDMNFITHQIYFWCIGHIISINPYYVSWDRCYIDCISCFFFYKEY